MTVISLKNTKMRTVKVEFDLGGVSVPEPGAVMMASVDATDKMMATMRTDTLLIDCIAVAGAVGAATLTVTGTLPDGVVLKQTQDFMVVAPEADTIMLTVGPEADKPIPPVAPVVVVSPAPPVVEPPVVVEPVVP